MWVMGEYAHQKVLFSYNIKMLTNKTELFNTVNRLGHGICYNLLEEIETKKCL